MKRRRPATLEPFAASAFVIVSLHVALTFGLYRWWQSQENPSSKAAPLFWQSPSDFKSNLPASTFPTLVATTPAAPPQPPADLKPALQPSRDSEPPVPKATLISPPPPRPEASAPAADAPPKATLVAGPPEQHRMEPTPNTTASSPLFAPAIPATKPAANRTITLRRMRTKVAAVADGKSPAPPMSSPSLLDIARLNSMRPNSLPKPGAKPPVTDDVENNPELDPVDEAVNSAFYTVWTAPPIDAVPPTQREARLNLSLGRNGDVLKAQMSKFSSSHVLDQSILEAAANVKKIPVTLPESYTKDSYDLELNFTLLP